LYYFYHKNDNLLIILNKNSLHQMEVTPYDSPLSHPTNNLQLSVHRVDQNREWWATKTRFEVKIFASQKSNSQLATGIIYFLDLP